MSLQRSSLILIWSPHMTAGLSRPSRPTAHLTQTQTLKPEPHRTTVLWPNWHTRVPSPSTRFQAGGCPQAGSRQVCSEWVGSLSALAKHVLRAGPGPGSRRRPGSHARLPPAPNSSNACHAGPTGRLSTADTPGASIWSLSPSPCTA